MEIYKELTMFLSLTIATLALLSAASEVRVTDPGTDSFVLTVDPKERGAEELLQGRYDSAISMLESPDAVPHGKHAVNTQRTAGVKSNLCVAQIMAGQFASAEETCDAAVKAAHVVKNAPVTPAAPAIGSHSVAGAAQQARALAIAYSNRAVLRWICQDLDVAATDLAEAKKLMPDSEIVALNIAVLHTPHPSVAQVQSAAPRVVAARR
jgi:hypothetical protein